MRKIDIGTTPEGKKVETVNLRGVTTAEQRKLAKKINATTQRIIDDGQYIPMGTPLFNFARPQYVTRQMRDIARHATTMCGVLFIDGEMGGVTRLSLHDVGHTPAIISRPGEHSKRVEYWLTPDHTENQELNNHVANRLVNNSAHSALQWDYINPEYEPQRAEAYGRLGFVALVTNRDAWIKEINGNGVKNTELWAKIPENDNPVYAEHMRAVAEEMGRLSTIQDQELVEKFSDRD